MSVAYMKIKVEERAGLADLSSSVLDKCAKDGRDPNAEERQQLDGWALRCKSLDDEIGQLEAQFRGNANFNQVLDRISKRDEDAERRAAADRSKPEPEQRTSLGQQFTESESFKDYDGHGSSKRVDFGGFLETRAAITTADLDIPAYEWAGPTGPTYTAPLLNVIGREPVSSGSVDYTVWGEASNAQVVPEGELKPEAELTATPGSATLDTFAHWKGITRQALEDDRRIQSIVETKLRRGLTNALSAAAADALSAAVFGTTAVDPTQGLSATIRAAEGTLQANGYQPNAVLLNPTTYAQLDIDASAGANNGPTAFGTYWGLRPIPVPGLPAGGAYVGDFQEALTWFDRNVTSVYMTDSHADYFIRNMLVILAETRAKFVATDLMAAIKITPAAEQAPAKASK